MPLRRKLNPPPVVPQSPPAGGAGGDGGRSRSRLPSAAMDWETLLRRLERKRRLLERTGGGVRPPDEYYFRATYASFRLEGLDVSEVEVRESLARGGHNGAGGGGERPAMLRSRQGQRIRNHAAILRRIETDLRDGLALTSEAVVRWYTGIAAGLSIAGLDRASMRRLDEMVRRLNSPQMRTGPAVREIAGTYARLLSDPLVPGFNGILSRLLLRYHMGRCKLPPVVFDAGLDGSLRSGEAMVRRLAELLEVSYDELLGRRRQS